MDKFKIRPYGVGELAALYFPHIQQSSAVNQLRRWVHESPELLEELQLGVRTSEKIVKEMTINPEFFEEL